MNPYFSLPEKRKGKYNISMFYSTHGFQGLKKGRPNWNFWLFVAYQLWKEKNIWQDPEKNVKTFKVNVILDKTLQPKAYIRVLQIYNEYFSKFTAKEVEDWTVIVKTRN